MNAYKELNIKEGMPITVDAMKYLHSSPERFRREKTKFVTVIHGYRSTAKGGMICNKARQWLKAQERQGKIKKVIFGENFTIFNFDALV